ncbi:MAG: HAD family hydrolase [Coriobacteriia bacterium]|nr:HAD family hydrolase [Coriobacteriia bacterium]
MRAVFLDKDGTLVEDAPYSAEPGGMRLAQGAGDALARLAGAGYALVVVSNQSGVARGFFAPSALRPMRVRLEELVAEAGVSLLDVAFCPHHPEGTVREYARVCGCRKPAPGMLLGVAERHGIDLEGSWMVGDILDDVEAGRRAGCRTVLLCNGGETEWRFDRWRLPDAFALDLGRAARAVLGEEGRHG